MPDRGKENMNESKHTEPVVYNEDRLRDMISARKNAFFTQAVWVTKPEFHTHPFWEICFVIKGHSLHHFPDGVVEMSVGSLYIIRPGDVHYIEPIDSGGYSLGVANSKYLHRDIYVADEKIRAVCDAISPDLYATIRSEKNPPSVKLDSSQVQYLEKTINYFVNNSDDYETMNTIIATHILCYVLEGLPKNDESRPQWINTLISNLFIESFMTMKMSEIIKSTNYSQCYVCRQFKKYTGTTLITYIQRMKCKYSLSLLSNPELSESDIAYRLDFSDQSAYIRIFKGLYGVTPGKYRKQLRGKQQ